CARCWDTTCDDVASPSLRPPLPREREPSLFPLPRAGERAGRGGAYGTMSAISAGSRIAFVTEGGPDVGLGHLSRCVALARAAAADGARASVRVRDDGQVASLLRDVHAEV